MPTTMLSTGSRAHRAAASFAAVGLLAGCSNAGELPDAAEAAASTKTTGPTTGSSASAETPVPATAVPTTSRPTSSPTRSQPPPRTAPLRVSVQSVAGQLDPSGRRRVEQRLGRGVGTWLQRQSASVQQRLSDVAVLRRQARLFLLAPGGRPKGATARVSMALRGTRSDGARVTVRLTGEAYLTWAGGTRWRVFGSDVSRSAKVRR